MLCSVVLCILQVFEHKQTAQAAWLVGILGDSDKLKYVLPKDVDIGVIVEHQHPTPVARHYDAAFAQDGGGYMVEHSFVRFSHFGFGLPDCGVCMSGLVRCGLKVSSLTPAAPAASGPRQ